METYTGPRKINRYLPRILVADAVWDSLLGIALVLAPWPSIVGPLGLPAAQPWPVFVILGIGCFGFAALLVRAARGSNTLEICNMAAIANAVAVIAVIVLLALLNSAGWLLLLAVTGVGCAVFAVLEWAGATALRRRPGRGNLLASR